VEGGAKVNHDFHHGSLCQRRFSMATAGLEVSAGRSEKGLLKMNTTFIMFVFMTHWPGLPLPGSPLVFSLS